MKQIRQYLRDGRLEAGEVPFRGGKGLGRKHRLQPGLGQKGMLDARVAQFERTPGAVDHTESFVVAAQALLAVQTSIQERRVVLMEREFPFAPCRITRSR